MTSQAITAPTLLIIMDRNSIKGWPMLTCMSSLSGGMLHSQIFHVGLASALNWLLATFIVYERVKGVHEKIIKA